MDEAVQATAGAMLDASGAIVVDCPCKHCGYNLRGLFDQGNCPECSAPVVNSLGGDLLSCADPQWVASVARGLRIILWMMLFGALVGLAAGIVALISPVMSVLAQVAISGVSYYGVWLMTEPDPSGIGETGPWSARRIVRITLVLGILGQLLELGFTGGGMSAGPFMAVLIASSVLLMLIGAVGEFAKFIYYERLARRIPDSALADRAKLLRWGYTTTLVVVLIGGAGGLAGFSGSGTPSGSLLAALGCMGVFAGIAWLIFGIMTLLMLIRLRRSVTEQARLAARRVTPVARPVT